MLEQQKAADASVAAEAIVPESLLEAAKTLLAEGRAVESEALFRRLVSVPTHAAVGFYGMGTARLAINDLETAASLFHQALALDPSNANACYQLGLIAERRNEPAQARSQYELALALAPEHAGANERLRAPMVGMEVSADAGPSSAIYAYLQQDASPLSRQTLAALDALAMRTRPTFTAYAGRRLLRKVTLLLIPIALVLALVALANRGTLHVAAGAVDALAVCVVAVVVAGIGVSYARVRSTLITIDKGRLQIRRGLLARRLVNVELWRVLEVELLRSFVNRLTGDGTLLLRTSGHGSIELVGLVRGSRLEDVYQQLLNAVLLLRGNPLVKGIVQ